MWNCIKNGLRNIFRKKLRSLLTVSGVAIGVISVLIISSIGEIGKQTINSELDSLGISGLSIGTEKTVTAKELGAEELEYVRAQSIVDDAMPLLMQYTSTAVRNELSSCLVWGINNSADRVVSLKIKYGS